MTKTNSAKLTHWGLLNKRVGAGCGGVDPEPQNMATEERVQMPVERRDRRWNVECGCMCVRASLKASL